MKIEKATHGTVFYFVFYFLASPRHVEVPGLGTEPSPQRWCQVLNLLRHQGTPQNKCLRWEATILNC